MTPFNWLLLLALLLGVLVGMALPVPIKAIGGQLFIHNYGSVCVYESNAGALASGSCPR